MLVVLGFLVAATGAHGYGNNFSCPYGKQGACLDYNDKVCSSFAKCVNQNAVCFDAYTCDHRGFICKSKFDNLAADYERVADNYDDLARNCRSLSDEYDALIEEHERLQRNYRNLSDCVAYANTLQEAQGCD